MLILLGLATTLAVAGNSPAKQRLLRDPIEQKSAALVPVASLSSQRCGQPLIEWPMTVSACLASHMRDDCHIGGVAHHPVTDQYSTGRVCRQEVPTVLDVEGVSPSKIIVRNIMEGLPLQSRFTSHVHVCRSPLVFLTVQVYMHAGIMSLCS